MDVNPYFSYIQLQNDKDAVQRENVQLKRELDDMSRLLTKCEKQRIEEKQEHLKERDRLVLEIKDLKGKDRAY